MTWLRTHYLVRPDGATVMEGVRDDGAHIGFAHNRQLSEVAARVMLDKALDTQVPEIGKNVDRFKGEDGWVEAQ